MKNIMLIGTVVLNLFGFTNMNGVKDYDEAKLSSREEVVEEVTEEKENEDTTTSNYATPQSGTNGSVVENVDQNNNDYEIGENEASKRQFVTITTKSGKEFHLIINHDKQGDNVQFLTEVSEQDLLNLVEIPKEETKVVEKEEQVEEIKPVLKEEVNTEEKSNTFLYLILFIMIAAVGYYLKIVKPKKNSGQNEFEDAEEEKHDECDSYISKEWEEFEE